MMPCKTVFGDRSIKITNKRYKSKVRMLEVYREALELEEVKGVSGAGGENIFEMEG